MEKLNELLNKLVDLTGVKDIAYHRIADGKLNPVLKTQTDALGMEKWKAVHAGNPVYIRNDSLLTEMFRNPGTVIVQDVKNDPRSQQEFFLFGIDSIMIIPVIRNAEIEGIVCTASIGSLHYFSSEEATEAEKLIEQYKTQI